MHEDSSSFCRATLKRREVEFRLQISLSFPKVLLKIEAFTYALARQLKAMSAYPLVDAAAKYCWGKGGQEVFKSYFDRHAPLFVVRTAPPSSLLRAHVHASTVTMHNMQYV